MPKPPVAARICYSFDAGFADCTLVSAYSTLKNGNVSELRFYTLGEMGDFGARVAKLRAAFPDCKILLEALPEELFNFTPPAPLTAATFARLLLLRILRGKWLYLDGDTLVLSSLSPLFEQPLGGKAFGGVLDYSLRRATARGKWRRLRRKLLRRRAVWHHESDARRGELMDMDRYINTGVLLFDTEILRTHANFDFLTSLEASSAFVDKHQLQYADQDWINYEMTDQIAYIHPRWNLIWGADPKARRFMTKSELEAVAEANAA
ncbi:MAG: glycosyltransferase, partial [Pseudomonadota bacterium]